MAAGSSPQRLVSVLILILLLFSFSSILESSQFCDAGIGHGESTYGVSSLSSTKLLIKGGTVVNAHDMEVADVYVQGGIIVTVKPIIKVGDDVIVLDATGKLVMPGIEFMGTETMDDFFSGQAAALAGINSNFFMANQGSFLVNDELLLEGFTKCKSLGALAMVHEENGDAVLKDREE